MSLQRQQESWGEVIQVGTGGGDCKGTGESSSLTHTLAHMHMCTHIYVKTYCGDGVTGVYIHANA